MAGSIRVRKLANPELLEKIDELFKSGIGEYVALPQLLVVGDQSSGKSSVLEGLTGIPFPRDKGLCTRFATQILFKRDPVQKTEVSIIADKDADKEHTNRVNGWRRDDSQEFDREGFKGIMLEARNLMGIDRDLKFADDESTSFSGDVLKIEICGPDEDHLSVIDIPGIFRKPTPGVTTKKDMSLVKKMVINYMKNPRSVILAVVPANADLATQEITQLASEEADSEGQRTLGVLTKPDLVDKGTEPAVLDILAGRTHQLNLGWFVVVNPGQKALDEGISDRDQAEKLFFSTGPYWNTVPKEQAGIPALKGRLIGILDEMVHREFPLVKKELNQRLKKCRQDLAALGPARKTREEQHEYLFDLASRFQDIAAGALRSDYGSSAFFDTHSSLRLATRIVDRNEEFSQDVEKFGHGMQFRSNNSNGSLQPAQEAPDFLEPEAPEERPIVSLRVRRTEGHWELEDILFSDEDITEPQETGVLDWLERVYKTSRGFEIGTFDPTIFPIIFKKQSANWEALALGYISDIISHIHTFITDLMSLLCVDMRVSRGIMSIIMDSLLSCYKKGIDHARFVLSVERAGTPLTLNHYFNDNLEKRRVSRFKAHVEKSTSQFTDTADKRRRTFVYVEEIEKISNNMSNLEHTVNDLHDILDAYYKVARKQFVDVMCMQAGDHHLVNGQNSPLRVFSPSLVNKLSTEDLERITGEDKRVREKRINLQHDIEVLEHGRKILL